MSCESCSDEAKERMRSIDAIKIKAKAHAKSTEQPIAICKDETGSYFITEAVNAIRNQFAIVEVVSNL